MVVIGRVVAEEQFDFCTLFGYDEHPTVHHHIGHLSLGILRRCLQDVDDLDSFFHDCILWDVYE